MSDPRLVLCTAPERDALRLAHAVVEEEAAACVNIVPGVTSVYLWGGEVCEDKEALLVIKTSSEVVGTLTDLLMDLHSYEVPEVIALPISADEGNAEYLKWLLESVVPRPAADD